MALPLMKPSFSGGELAPSVWGRQDVSKVQASASVVRNMYVSYTGGIDSRAGFKFVGQCKQVAGLASIPPRAIPFSFNIFQNFVLEFGDRYMRIVFDGAYVTETPFNITTISNANPCQITVPGNDYVIGDWIFINNVEGTVELNGRTFIVENVAGDVVTIADTFGDAVNSVNLDPYVSGGTAARIYTVTSPYAVTDLPYLKYVQSASVMSFACVNQTTGAGYPPYDLSTTGAADWTFTEVQFGASIAAPANISAAATVTTGTTPTQYAFVVTAIDAITGEESVASPVAYVTDSVDISVTAGSLIITWSTVTGASEYNIYMAPPSYDAAVPIGSLFGYIGSAFGNQFVNSNIQPDFTTSPPLHLNPFARSTLLGVNFTNGGTGYVQATTVATINTTTGSGQVIAPVVVGGVIVAVVVENGGQGLAPGDTITFSDSGGGSGAAGQLVIGPATGTYPAVVAYFQERRVYASTLNNPDTYFMSQTGAYTNFDASSPPVDSDSIIGTPWGQQVNGIQWLTPMPGGLIVATGLDAWQVSGAAGAGAPVTPSSQSAQQQESNGFNPTLEPLKINYDILYGGSLGALTYDMVYNFWNNIYAGTDISVMSNHLFNGFAVTQWGWARQPYKIVWAVRSDGKFLSLTFLKEQEIVAWARHDTNGLAVSVCIVTEPPANVPYFIMQRYIIGKGQWAYYMERMDDRIWQGPEEPWCVDCGLSLIQPTPNATLTADAAEGPGTITGGYIAEGGQNYSNPSAQIIDPAGTGSGSSITFEVTAGAISGFTFVPGAGYSAGTYVQISDPTGSGAAFVIFISQNVLFTASAAVFSATNVGDVIRVGGGIANVTAINSVTQVLAAVVKPIIQTIPNDPNNLPAPASAGNWTITTPVSSVTNLDHLEGMQVSILADGAVVAGGSEPLITVVNGSVALPAPASAIVVGLPFIAQLQSMHADVPGQSSVQGKRKKITKGVIRLQQSRGVQVGADQPVASTLDHQQEIPWTNMRDVPDLASVNVPPAALPLFTGDKVTPIGGDWQNWNGYEPSPGMMCAQQLNPLPMSVLALIPSLEFGDSDA